MIISEIVDELKEAYTNGNIVFVLGDSSEVSYADYHGKEFNKEYFKDALLKICSDWNREEKSRGFIKHLIYSFVIAQPTFEEKFSEEVLSNKGNRCAILHVWLSGANEAIQKAIEMQKAANEKTRDEAKIKKLNKEFNTLLRPVAWKSDKSEKFLSNEARMALCKFVMDCEKLREKEVLSCLSQPQVKAAGQKSSRRKGGPKQGKSVNSTTAQQHLFSIDSIADEDTISKLLGLKGSMKSNKKE